MPDVSVVIPTHNRWPLMWATVSGALRQEDVEVEVLVVDDASTDETSQRLAELDDPRVRPFRQERNLGQAAARNRGVAEARAEWIAFLDDDDLWAPRKLRTQLDALARGDAVFCYGDSVVWDEENSVVVADAALPDPRSLPERLLEGNVIPGGCSNILVRADVARRVGGFDDRLSVLSDWDFWVRLADQGPGLACPEVLVVYRRHAQNLHVRDVDHMVRELEYFSTKHGDTRGMRFDPIGYSRWLAAESPSRWVAARIYLSAGLTYRSPGNLARALAMALPVPRPGRPAEVPVPEPEWLRLYR